jgi:hypothetical protein
VTPSNVLKAGLCSKVLFALVAALAGCGFSAEPERWASLLEENSVFVGSLVVDCGEGPEDFEYSNSTLGIPVQLALAIDGRRLSARVRSLAEGHASPPADLSGRLEGDGSELSLVVDDVFAIGNASLTALRLTDLRESSEGLNGIARATLETQQGDDTYTCALRGRVELVPDTRAPSSHAYTSDGAIELWFEEPTNVAKLAISAEAQGREVEIALTPVAEDDEGFVRSVLITPRSEWPATEVTLHLENATDVAGNIHEPYEEEISLPSRVTRP